MKKLDKPNGPNKPNNWGNYPFGDTMDKEFVKKAYELYLVWEKVYRMEAKECDYQALDWVYCPKEGRDDKKYRRDVRTALKGQIEFINTMSLSWRSNHQSEEH